MLSTQSLLTRAALALCVSVLPTTFALAQQTHTHGGSAPHSHSHSHGNASALIAAPVAKSKTKAGATAKANPRRWLAGDHHIHSHYSVGYDRTVTPPKPIIAGDAIYPTPVNAAKARQYKLDWMVTTDHGGPNHAKLNRDVAYPELVRSRLALPEVLQFYGMEFNAPALDHHSLIIPRTKDEKTTLFDLESRFDTREAFPLDPNRDTEPKMLEALRFMRGLAAPPAVIAHHPSRSATGLGVYGLDTPRELRQNHDAAPGIYLGMEGAPGHQAAALNRDGTPDGKGIRGAYNNFPTMGGFDQATARLGGLWDSLLGEGRRFWITATSDSHGNFREGYADFWPGEYSKTYVFASKTYDSVLEGLRQGRIFVTTGDLISSLDISARAVSQNRTENRTERAPAAAIGETLAVSPQQNVEITIRLRDPKDRNAHGDRPTVRRVDLIVGGVTGRLADTSRDTNPTTRVVKRFTSGDWKRNGEILTMTYMLPNPGAGAYIRVRGTSTSDLEPPVDPRGENPWDDLWFYSNPIFLEVRPANAR